MSKQRASFVAVGFLGGVAAGSLVWSVVGGVVYLFLKQREHLDEVTKAPLAEEPGDAL